MRVLSILLLTALVLGTACGGDSGGHCTDRVSATFGSVLDGEDVVDVTIRDIRLERLGGDVQGFHEGLSVSLLMYGAELQVTGPCGASAVEVVLDQTQVGVTVSVFEAGSESSFHTDYSETSTDLEPEAGDFQRWTITWPSDHRARRIVLSNAGTSGVSTLIKSITFL